VGDSVLPLSKLIHSFQARFIIDSLITINESSPDRVMILFKRWIELYEDIPSPFLKTCSLLALVEVIRLRNPLLESISVPGYAVVDTKAPRRTRSQGPAAAVTYRQIPLLAKVISLLVNELFSSEGTSSSSSDSNQKEGGFLDAFAVIDEFLEENDQPEESLFASDPMFTIELPSFVPSLIRDFAQSQPEFANSCFAQLAENEQVIVRQCLYG
jgi:hypothetical protein